MAKCRKIDVYGGLNARESRMRDRTAERGVGMFTRSRDREVFAA
jgi:hypothetical protein